MWLQDTGILVKLRDDELNAPFPVPRPKVKFNEPLTLRQLNTAFIWWAVGIVVSMSIFSAELLAAKNCKKLRGPKRGLM